MYYNKIYVNRVWITIRIKIFKLKYRDNFKLQYIYYVQIYNKLRIFDIEFMYLCKMYEFRDLVICDFKDNLNI